MHYYENIKFIIDITNNIVSMSEIITKEIKKHYIIKKMGNIK